MVIGDDGADREIPEMSDVDLRSFSGGRLHSRERLQETFYIGQFSGSSIDGGPDLTLLLGVSKFDLLLPSG